MLDYEGPLGRWRKFPGPKEVAGLDLNHARIFYPISNLTTNCAE